jgi:hypothetical protein
MCCSFRKSNIRRRVEASTGFELDGETFRLIRLKRNP